jgi:hypothetical protein
VPAGPENIPEFITNEEFRKELSEIALRVAERGHRVDIGSNPTRPTYVLDPVDSVPIEVRATAVPLKPDRMRKWLTSIRALLRVEEGWAFGIVIGAEVVAILRRHPSHDSSHVYELRRWRNERQQVTSLPTLEDRLEAIEGSLRRLESRFNERKGVRRHQRG